MLPPPGSVHLTPAKFPNDQAPETLPYTNMAFWPYTHDAQHECGKDKLGTGEVEASGSGARRFRVIESDGGAPSFPHWCCAYGQLMLSETTPA